MIAAISLGSHRHCAGACAATSLSSSLRLAHCDRAGTPGGQEPSLSDRIDEQGEDVCDAAAEGIRDILENPEKRTDVYTDHVSGLIQLCGDMMEGWVEACVNHPPS